MKSITVNALRNPIYMYMVAVTGNAFQLNYQGRWPPRPLLMTKADPGLGLRYEYHIKHSNQTFIIIMSMIFLISNHPLSGDYQQ